MWNILWNSCLAQVQENLMLAQKLAGSYRSWPNLYRPYADGLAREKVHQYGQATVYRYPGSGNSEAVPLLIVYALVNKPYMLDLAPNRSFIRGLSKGDMDIYLIEWQDPKACADKPTLENYIEDTIDNVVQWIATRHRRSDVDLMGICQGGIFSLIYAALHPENIKNLVPMVTPLDFHVGDSIFTHLARYCDTHKMSETLATIPGDFMNASFLQIKPFESLLGKYLKSYKVMDDPNQLDMFLRMEKWIFDSPDQSGPAWDKFIRDCYQDNKLVKNQMQLAGKTVDLKRIHCPVLSVTAVHDHIVPPASSEPLGQATSSNDYTHLSFPVGHIGMFVGSKTDKQITPAIVDWLAKRKS